MTCLNKIFILSPGPKYNLENSFRKRCESLSEHYHGTVLTSGPSFINRTYGNFNIICVKDPFVKSWVSTVCFFSIGLLVMFKSIVAGDKYELFVTTDPLKTGLIGSIICTIFNIKLVVEVNGDHMSDAIYIPIRSFYKRHLRKLIMIWVEKYVLDHSSGVKLLYSKQIDKFKPLPNQAYIDYFPDYVNSDAFINIEDAKEILFVGFPFSVKGVDILIAAFKNVSPKHKNWTLKILGYYPDMTQLNKHIASHDKIHHHKPVNPAEMPEHIGKCGIFVLPSRTEAMGRVLVEAMAAGKPRIGSNVGGIPTVINDNVDGLLFESENIENLSQKLDQLMSSKSLRDELGREARKRYEAEFKSEDYFYKLNSFYSNVINN